MAGSTQKASLGVTNYSIEQQKTDEDLIAFVRALYENARDVAKDVVHDEIAYCRTIVRSQHGKDYVGFGDDDEYYEETDLQDTRRFRSSMCNQKNKQLARKQTRQKPKTYIRISDLNMDDPVVQQKVAQFGGPEGLKDTLQHLYDDWWVRNQIDTFNYLIVKSAHDEGTAMTVTYWDADANMGQGDLVWKQVRPENFYPEPGVIRVEDLSYYFVVRILDLRRAVNEYGEKVLEAVNHELDELKEGLRVEEIDSDDATKIKVGIITGVFKDDTCLYYDYEGKKITKKQYDKGIEAVESLNDSSADREYGYLEPTKIPLYPNGRVITFSGGTMLEDRANPFEFCPHGKYVANSIAYSFWGEPTTRDMSVIQENFDKTMQGALQNLFLFGFPTGFFKEDAINDTEFRETYGRYFTIKGNEDMGRAMMFHPGANVAGDAWQIAGMMRALSEDISGLHQASEGRGTSQKSGRQTIALQEQTNEYLSQPARAFETFLKNEGRKHLWLLHRFAQAGREYEYENQMGERVKGTLPMDLSELDMVIDLVVSPGSSIPEDKESKANRALALHQADPMVFNSNWLIKELGYDNDPMLMSPVMQYQRLQQQMAQMVQQNPQEVQNMVQQGQVAPDVAQQVMAQMAAQQQPQQIQQGQADVERQRQMAQGR